MTTITRPPRPQPPRRQTRKRSLSERAAGHPLALGIATLIAAALIAYLSWVVTEGVPFLQKYSVKAVLPADGPVARKGTEVRVGGKLAGKVSEVAAAGDGRLITMKLKKHTPIHSDAKASLHIRGLAGAVYIDLRLGSRGPELPNESTIPAQRTDTGQDLSEVAAGFGPAARSALAGTLNTYGLGLLGTGEPLNRAIEDLPALTRDGTRLLRAATPTPTALADLLGGLDRVSRGFAGTAPSALGRLISAGNQSLAALDASRDNIAQTIRAAEPTEDAVLRTLPLAKPVLSDLAATSRTLSPGLEELNRALPALNRLLATPQRLTRISRLTDAASPVLSSAPPLLDRIRPFAKVVHPLLEPLIPLARYMDPYREDVVQAMVNLASTGANRYPEGMTRPERAIRFTPIFTPMRCRNPFPAPNASEAERC